MLKITIFIEKKRERRIYRDFFRIKKAKNLLSPKIISNLEKKFIKYIYLIFLKKTQ